MPTTLPANTRIVEIARDHALVVLWAATGANPGQLARATWERTCLEPDVAAIELSPDRRGGPWQQHWLVATGDPLTCPLIALSRLRNSTASSGPLFRNDRGAAMSRQGITKTLSRVIAAGGRPAVSLSATRLSYDELRQVTAQLAEPADARLRDAALQVLAGAGISPAGLAGLNWRDLQVGLGAVSAAVREAGTSPRRLHLLDQDAIAAVASWQAAVSRVVDPELLPDQPVFAPTHRARLSLIVNADGTLPRLSVVALGEALQRSFGRRTEASWPGRSSFVADAIASAYGLRGEALVDCWPRGPHHAQAAEALAHHLATKDPATLAAALVAAYAGGSPAREVIHQSLAPSAPSAGQVVMIAAVRRAVAEGLVAIARFPVGRTPSRDRDAEANAGVLTTALPGCPTVAPDRGPGARNDGTWAFPGGERQLNDRATLRVSALCVPLEIGGTDASRTFLHLAEDGCVARWPYGSDEVTLLVVDSAAWVAAGRKHPPGLQPSATS